MGCWAAGRERHDDGAHAPLRATVALPASPCIVPA